MPREKLAEIAQMVLMDHLDIRAVTLGMNILPCARTSATDTAQAVKERILRRARHLVGEANKVENLYGIPIKNRRIAVTPVGMLAESCSDHKYDRIAHAMDAAVRHLNEEATLPEKGITFIGGYSAHLQKGYTESERSFVKSIADALAGTRHVCSSVNVASTKAGINMEAVLDIAKLLKGLAEITEKAHGCAKFVVFCNAPEDNPFMAGAFHGIGEAEAVINVGISGPSVIRRVVDRSRDVDLSTVADRIKRAIFKVVRAGELVGRKLAGALGVSFGSVDLSLAPTPTPAENSIACLVEAIGVESFGTHGTTVALALLIDAVKKGGVAASSCVGGLSGAFIPVSEDSGMVDAVARGSLTLDKLEALTSICSVGLDMFGIPGSTPVETVAAIIADEMAIGVLNNKTTAVRVLPVPNARPGDLVDLTEYNDLLGKVIVMPVHQFSATGLFRRLRVGRVPAPLRSLTN